MNPSLNILFEEHSIILNAIDVTKQVKSLIGKDDEKYEKTVRDLINFFKNYADKYHHHKEEIILFPEMAKRNELVAEGIIKEMLDNHDDFRETISSIERKLNEKKYAEAQSELEVYANAMFDHITVENSEVFQMAETMMSESELENIYYRFLDCDRELGETVKVELSDLINSLRTNLMLAS